MTTDVRLITNALRDYERLANAGDASQIAALYDENAILFPDRFDAFTGVAEIEGFYAAAFSMLTLDIEFQIDPSQIVVAGDVAYATTTSHGTRFLKASGETVPEVNRELWVLAKQGDGWLIARYCFNKAE